MRHSRRMTSLSSMGSGLPPNTMLMPAISFRSCDEAIPATSKTSAITLKLKNVLMVLSPEKSVNPFLA
jgi:hypothetical protein